MRDQEGKRGEEEEEEEEGGGVSWCRGGCPC